MPEPWDDVLPEWVAKRQVAYERHLRALRMRELGMTFSEIGRRFGVERARAQMLVKLQRQTPPVVEFFHSPMIGKGGGKDSYRRLYANVQRLVVAIEEARHA